MSIGDTLKDQREKKKLSIVDVSGATRISKKYVQAMEDNNFMLIPSPVFAKGFLKTYAGYLGLDVKELLAELSDYYKNKEETKKPNISYSKPSKALHGKNAMYLTYLAIFIIVLFLVLYEYRLNYGGYKIASTKSTVEATAEESSVPPTSEVATKRIIAPAVENRRGVRVKAVAKSWISVISDGALVYTGTLEGGYWINFRGKEVKVKTVNAGGIRVFVNGEDLGPMGAIGEVAEKTYNPYQ